MAAGENRSVRGQARTLIIDGHSLTPEDVYEFSYNTDLAIALSPEAWDRVDEARKTVNDILESGKVAYGVRARFWSGTCLAVFCSTAAALTCRAKV